MPPNEGDLRRDAKLAREEANQSKKTFIDAIIKYVDAKIDYELASIEIDEDGYMGSCVEERKAMEAAKEALLKCADSQKLSALQN